ncbi:Muniscin C-terminal [Arabidopsis suecica]|uniref:Muniscin C-terminal n=1 Tax=Arabidopsis suecica TaxID=45249 RepID=A0A8T2DR19_ARASU|nr:Muniscin C-terminal [Arabidopsis suecica]
MSCLALALQPANGSDILLQTREWFPPARALIALSYFRQMRQALASSKQQHQQQSNQKQNQASSSSSSSSVADPDDATAAEFVGDDPLAASNGQVIVGVESKYRVVYRLVNSIYILGVTVADHDNSINVFECIHIVNQAVSVIVTACRGVEVTPEKLGRKYAEVYMALDIVLRGVSNIRLAAMLGAMHGDGIAKMVHSALDTENKIRGADSWMAVESHAAEHQASVNAFSNARFELPPETVAAGDEFAASLAPVVPESEQLKEEPEPENKDPFAASETINKEKELVGGFKKTKDPSSTDLTLALAGLEVTTLPPAEATQSTHINVEGFEGQYGGIEFSNEQATIGETFESFSDAWGGGLDPSEFMGPKKIQKKEGLGGLELLHTSDPKAVEGKDGVNIDNLVKKPEMKGPEMYISEEIRTEFRESLLARVGVMGVIYLKTMPPKGSGEEKETEFSFRVEGTTAVKRFAMQSSRISSLGNGLFHVRTAPSEEPIPILKYSLQPKLTPLPLRVRMVKRISGTLLSLMIQYVSNPDLPQPLKNVDFILKLPVDPTLLKVSPKAILNRTDRELKWQIPEIPLNGSPGRLRARMPIDSDNSEEEPEIICYVKFSVQGNTSLSGMSLRAAAEGNTDFFEVDHRYETGVYMCN